MEESGNLGNREVMDEKLRAAAKDGDLVSFVKEARKNEIESGCSEEYFLRQTSIAKLNILQLAILYDQNEFIEKVFKGGEELLPRSVIDQLINQQDNYGDTPIHDAARWGKIDFFKFLFEYKERQQGVRLSLSMQNNDGDTPLHVAVEDNNIDFFKLLFEHKEGKQELLSSLSVQNNKGDTPLHVAAKKGNIDFFKFLFEYEEGQQQEVLSNLRVQNKDGNTPLHLALIKSKVEVATLLVERYPDLARCCQNNDGNTLLHVAAEVGNFDEIFKLVLEYDDKQAEVKNKDGNTPLHVAFLNGRVEMARLLVHRLEQHPELARVTNNMKETPLHLAIEQYRHIINLPIKERKAVGSTYFDMIKYMIEKESCIACWQDTTGRTPLHRAAPVTSTYTLPIIRLILYHCPHSVEVFDNSSKTILHLLKAIPSYKEAKELLGIPKLFGLVNHQDKDGNTPLHSAAMNLNHNLVQVLLNSSAERSTINNDGITAEALIQEQFEMTMEVCEATERMDVTFLKERLHKFGMIFLSPRDSERRNVLHKLMQINTGMTILHTDDFVDFVKQVVESFPELICQVDHNGNTPLHILVQNSPDTVIPFASDIELCNYKVSSLSDSPLVLKLLELLCWYNNRAQEEASVRGDRYVPPWLVQNVEGNTPLHEALRVNQGADVVRKLLELDIESTAKLTNKLNETPLHLLAARPPAAETLDEDDITTLVKANMDAACKFDKNGLTPLLRAAQIYKLDTILALLNISPGATYMADEKYGKTLCHLLISFPSYSTWSLLRLHPELLTGLLKCQDYEGNTPLHLATQLGRFDHALNFLSHMEVGLMKHLMETKNEAHTSPIDSIRSAQEIPIEVDLMLQLVDLKNDAGIRPSDSIRSAQEIPDEIQYILKKSGLVVGIRSVWDVPTSQISEYANSMCVVAALITTITFTAAFTVPGGLVQEKGVPLLIREAAFQAFMVSNILAMCLSMMVLFCLLWVVATTNQRKSVILMDFSMLLLLLSLYATLVAFMMGVYVTTIHAKPWIAIITLVICSLLMLLLQKNLVMDILVPAVKKGLILYGSVRLQIIHPLCQEICRIFSITRLCDLIR